MVFPRSMHNGKVEYSKVGDKRVGFCVRSGVYTKGSKKTRNILCADLGKSREWKL